jgi:diamine N-acetyltransferase
MAFDRWHEHHRSMVGPAIVSLREITDGNRDAVTALAVAPGQEQFVDNVADSLDEAAETPDACPWYRAIYADQEPVGFIMITDGIRDDHPEYEWPYYLWRLIIDARHQRRGYGTAALDLVVAYVRTRPGAEAFYTSAVPGDGSPMTFYEHYGYAPTGGMLDGEHVYRLPLH